MRYINLRFTYLLTYLHGPKIGGYVPFERGAGFSCNTLWPGPRPTFVPSGILIHPAVWPQQTWAEISGGAVSLAGGAGSASNTMLPGPRPTIVLSGILIQHPFGHNRHGQKIEGSVPFWGGGSWVPI